MAVWYILTQLNRAGRYITKSYKHDVFGNIISETGPAFNRGFTYTSRERHARSGFYYYRARLYDPQTGRFLTQDPIGPLGGVNLYAYVGDSPVNLIDPLGLFLMAGADILPSIEVPKFSNVRDFAEMIDSISNDETTIIIVAHGEPGGRTNVGIAGSDGTTTYNLIAGKKLYEPLINKKQDKCQISRVFISLCAIFPERRRDKLSNASLKGSCQVLKSKASKEKSRGHCSSMD